MVSAFRGEAPVEYFAERAGGRNSMNRLDLVGVRECRRRDLVPRIDRLSARPTAPLTTRQTAALTHFGSTGAADSRSRVYTAPNETSNISSPSAPRDNWP